MPTNKLPRYVLGLALLLAVGSMPIVLTAADEQPAAKKEQLAPEPEFEVRKARGQVVWFETALEQRLGIKTVTDAEHRHLALQTTDRNLISLIEDLRAHAFRTDPRLREMQVELLVRRYVDTPGLQVLRVYKIKEDEKLQIDYWCDVCAIAMFETGSCSCCQEDNRLRKRTADGREFGE